MLADPAVQVAPSYTTIQVCRLCGERELQPVIAFGDLPLSNSFLSAPDEPEDRFPLEVVFCPFCALVQLSETIAPERLFRNYNYFSSVSAGMLTHAQELAADSIRRFNLNRGSHVVELASNDGYLLQYFAQAGIPTLGVDPAQNVAQVAATKGVPTLTEFFGRETARLVPKADLVLALNVLGHVADLNGFVDGIRQVLKPNGTAIVEIPYIRPMIEGLAPDTMYFEHLFYFSLTALVGLFKRNGLQVVKAERLPVHCGSIRIYITHPNAFPPDDRYGLAMIQKAEDALGVAQLPYYQFFAIRVKEALRVIRSTLVEKRKAGKRIVGFGAAAKGVQLLNYLHAGVELVDYVVDETPAKIGKFLPGTHQRVAAPSEIGPVDVAFLLAWNWQNEFRDRFPGMAGKWLIPFPQLRTE